MKITWLGHACFKLESGSSTLVLDPYSDGSVPGLGPVRESADLVLCSHGHGDHNASSCVTLSGSPSAFTVTKIATYHDEVQGAKRGPNTIHIISDGKCRVAHLGDLGCALPPEQLQALKGLDVLMIPVGGFFTIDAAQAKALVEQLQPAAVIPMHYRSSRFGYDVIANVESFTSLLPGAAVLPGSTLDTESPMPAVAVLQPANLV